MIKKQGCSWGEPGVLDRLEWALKQGQVVLGTSDTVAGLLATLTLQGFEALNQVKGRSEKPYLVLAKNAQVTEQYCQQPLSRAVQRLMVACWPGPLTLLMRAKSDVPQFIARNGVIGVRVPNHQGLLALLGRCGGLFSTSANLTGHPVPEKVAEVDKQIMDRVACIVEDEGKVATVPSTILDCTGEKIKVVREGAYAIAELEQICGQKFEC